nr:hypothetical protein [Pseudomonas kuykendallii]
MTWQLVYTKQDQKDAWKLAAAVCPATPSKKPPPHEKPMDDLTRAYSRRINIRHRLAYQFEGAQAPVPLRVIDFRNLQAQKAKAPRTCWFSGL